MEKANLDRLLRVLLMVSLLPVLVVVGYQRSGREEVPVPPFTVELANPTPVGIRPPTTEYTVVRRETHEMGLFGFQRSEKDSVPFTRWEDEPKVRVIRRESWFDGRGVVLSFLAGGALPCAVWLAHWLLVTRHRT